MKIWVTTRFEALHKWPAAPDNVDFLKNSHRHIFHVKLLLNTHHADRELEFITVKRELEQECLSQIIEDMETDNQSMSCEMIGMKIKEWAEEKYNRGAEVHVSEDGENGAIV